MKILIFRDSIKKYLIIINSILLLLLALSTLWPLEFNPENRVYRLPGGTGLLFDRGGMVTEHDNNEGMASLLAKHPDIAQLSFEVFLRPLSRHGDTTSVILCLYNDHNPEILEISQFDSSLVVQHRRSHSYFKNTYHEIYVPGVLLPGKKSLITLVINNEGARVLVDGDEKAYSPAFTLRNTMNEIRNSHLLLGNDPTVNDPLHAELHGGAIYAAAPEGKNISRHVDLWKQNKFKALSREKNIVALYPISEKKGPSSIM